MAIAAVAILPLSQAPQVAGPHEEQDGGDDHPEQAEHHAGVEASFGQGRLVGSILKSNQLHGFYNLLY